MQVLKAAFGGVKVNGGGWRWLTVRVSEIETLTVLLQSSSFTILLPCSKLLFFNF